MPPDIGLFVAAADDTDRSLAALAALIEPDQIAGMIETTAWPTPPGCTVVGRSVLVQMVAPHATIAPAPID